MFLFLFVGQKKIKPGWFDHNYCGLALGYARNHQSRMSYVRCLICKRDIKVRSRGITTFIEHCRGLRHHRQDCVVRLHRGLPLRRRDGTLMSSEESAECRANLGGVTVPFMETCPPLSVIEVFELEGPGRPVWSDEQEGDDWPERTVRLFVFRGRRLIPRLSIHECHELVGSVGGFRSPACSLVRCELWIGGCNGK